MNLILGALKSKTIWVNTLLVGAAASVEAFGGGLIALGIDPTIQALIVGAVNFVLRYLTSQSLESKA